MFLAGEIRETSQQKVLQQLRYLNTLEWHTHIHMYVHMYLHTYVHTSVPVWDWPYVHSWAFYFRTVLHWALVTVIVGVKGNIISNLSEIRRIYILYWIILAALYLPCCKTLHTCILSYLPSLPWFTLMSFFTLMNLSKNEAHITHLQLKMSPMWAP